MADEQSRQRNQVPASIPPPGSIVPVARVRHLVTADGARIPYTRAELGWLFNAGPIQQIIFGILETRDAVSLRHAVHARDQNGDLLRIPNTTCEDPNLGFTAGGRDAFNRSSDLDQSTNCNAWIPLGFQELSLCCEPLVVVNQHWPNRYRRVCKPCKDKRFQDINWRRRQLLFGVCTDCRVYANSLTIPPDRLQCDCSPNTRWTDGTTGNQAHAAHMCLPHDWEDWWFHTAPRAQIEMDARYRLRFRKKPTRIAYKKSKKATPPDQMTPFQRRHCMKVVRRGRPDAVPRCFCGNAMSHAEHFRPNGRKVTNAAGVLVPIYQWRSCTGCNAFVNTNV
ncbi:hypothetical protein LTR82_017410 [Friedmanniomyces endolithicus]|uniref:Uncharacterized protein n=1 Tax=Friedmanniomyces endolithicus TaxID=329885 RepID=A0AAN6F4R1_9PEZI|nr:hypothetical protein LTR82_017410 [Friedmanniomyces endolithicus]